MACFYIQRKQRFALFGNTLYFITSLCSGAFGEVMLEKFCLATAITFSLYLLVKIPGPTGPTLVGSSQSTAGMVVAAQPQP